MKTFAIGDVHGMIDQLKAAMSEIEIRASVIDGDKQVVLLGDYIDRGPDSAGCVEAIMGWDPGFPVIALRGNHEQMFMDANDDWENTRSYMARMGRDDEFPSGYDWYKGYPETLNSYLGRDHLIDKHVGWMRGLPFCHRSGDHLYVHAGIRPKKSIEAQAEHDMIWIRYDFLQDQREYGFVVVHGHTPYEDCPHVKPNRINMDSMAFFTGRLTVGIIDSDRRVPPQFFPIEGAPSPQYYEMWKSRQAHLGRGSNP